MKIILSFLCIVLMLPAAAQRGYTIDSCYLSSGVAYRFRNDGGVQFQRSADHGRTWTAIGSKWKHNNKEYDPWAALMSTTIHFINDSTGFAIGGTDCYQWRDYMLRTGDGGQTWERVFSLRDEDVALGRDGMMGKKMMHFSDANNGMLVLASYKSEVVVARTSDAGLSWKTENTSLPEGYYPVKLIFADALKGEIILEAKDKTPKKLLTTDGGKTWKLKE